jgi:hypothetical protein
MILTPEQRAELIAMEEAYGGDVESAVEHLYNCTLEIAALQQTNRKLAEALQRANEFMLRLANAYHELHTPFMSSDYVVFEVCQKFDCKTARERALLASQASETSAPKEAKDGDETITESADNDRRS